MFRNHFETFRNMIEELPIKAHKSAAAEKKYAALKEFWEHADHSILREYIYGYCSTQYFSGKPELVSNDAFYQIIVRLSWRIERSPHVKQILKNIEQYTIYSELLKSTIARLAQDFYDEDNGWKESHGIFYDMLNQRLQFLLSSAEHLGYILPHPDKIAGNQIKLSRTRYNALRVFGQVFEFGILKNNFTGDAGYLEVDKQKYRSWWEEYAAKALTAERGLTKYSFHQFINSLPRPEEVEDSNQYTTIKLTRPQMTMIHWILDYVAIDIKGNPYSHTHPCEIVIDVAAYKKWWAVAQKCSIDHFGMFAAPRAAYSEVPTPEDTNQERGTASFNHHT